MRGKGVGFRRLGTRRFARLKRVFSENTFLLQFAAVTVTSSRSRTEVLNVICGNKIGVNTFVALHLLSRRQGFHRTTKSGIRLEGVEPLVKPELTKLIPCTTPGTNRWHRPMRTK